MPNYPQGAAALDPGLCAFALTARAGQCIFYEQVVRVNRNSSILGTTNWTPYLLIMSNENIDKNGKILFSCTFSLDYFTE